MLHHYTAFGVPVESELEMECLFAGIEDALHAPDTIRIKTGTVPAALSRPELGRNVYGTYNRQECLVTIPSVAKFYIAEGKDIIVQLLSNHLRETEQILVSNLIPLLLYQRNQALLHCSGVFISESEVVLFAADKNTGKSTLALLLQQRGYPVFTDDTARITFRKQACYADPAYPVVRLDDGNPVTGHVNRKDSPLKGHRGEDGKTAYPLHSHFTARQARVAGLFFLTKADDTFLRKLLPVAALAPIIQNIYRHDWLIKMQKHEVEFELWNGLMQTVPMWRAGRTAGVDTYEQFTSMIEQEIISLSGNNKLKQTATSHV